jgi:DNA-binding transcriptional regulator YiaG
MTPADLIALRGRLGLTQTELAAALPVSLRTVQLWEAQQEPLRGIVARALRDLEHERKWG